MLSDERTPQFKAQQLTRTFGLACILAAGLITSVSAQNLPASPCLATPLSASIDDGLVFPDGTGLPSGSGSADSGEAIFQQRCQACHGQEGIGATAVELVGDHQSLNKEFPTKAVGSYWLAAPPLLAYIQQAMPPQNLSMREPRLSNDESYAVVAYILSLNGLWAPQATLDADKLAAIKMPNRDGFDNGDQAEQAKAHQLNSVCAQ